MRRYLDEFLSDRRVIDYPRWKWQPLLQLGDPDQAPVHLRRQLPQDLEHRGATRARCCTITRDAGGGGRGAHGRAARRPGRRRLRHALRQPLDALGDRAAAGAGLRADRVLPALSAVLGADHRHRQRPGVPGADGAALAAGDPHGARPTTTTRSTSRRWRSRSRRPTPASPRRPDLLVTSYHGMPRALPARGRPLPLPLPQDDAAAARPARASPTDEVVVTFQSRFGREEWLKPYTVEEVARLAQAGQAPHRGDGAGLLVRLRRDAGGDQGRDPRGLPARGRRGLHLHPLPQRRRRRTST